MQIYKIINIINNKIYIGMTKQSINARFANHLNRAKYEDRPLANAINKYGKEAFRIDTIFNCQYDDSVYFMEMFFIEALKSYKRNVGYNATFGGDSGNSTPESRAKLSRSHKGKKVSETQLEGLRIGRLKNQKTLYRTCLKTGEVKIYKSLYEAGLDGFNTKNLSRSISKRRGMSYGYLWSFEQNALLKPKKPNPQIKSVVGTNIKTGKQVVYKTMSDVRKDGFHIGCVSQCCNGINKAHKGYKFEFTNPADVNPQGGQ